MPQLTSGNLVIPIVTWAPTPPIHKICCILASDDGNDIVTGASDGNMILWSVGKNSEFTARWMVTGHRAPVLHLCLAGSRSDEDSRVFFTETLCGSVIDPISSTTIGPHLVLDPTLPRLILR
ncbi:unnamed protein product [Echinostoma caproni]|uniref:WD_REPEATS_REGION domain-containing protein n=1 Tax=Echinostoma caproni TaxID=27848 RepID=A0A3P8L3I2_9TREM|nr:unnamed protein product [Echinostoma caproni]